MEKPGKKFRKTLCLVLGCVVLWFIISLCKSFLFITFIGYDANDSTNDLSQYGAYLDCVTGSRDFMPAPEDCGAYQKAKLSKREHLQPIFDYYSVCLLLQYTEEEYDRQAELIEQNYLFFQEPTYALHEVTASIGGYEVRMVEPAVRIMSPVKGSLLIGFNDDLHAIMYAYYDDMERDYIDDLDKALKEYLYIPRDWKS